MALLSSQKSIIDIFNDMSFEETEEEILTDSDENRLDNVEINYEDYDEVDCIIRKTIKAQENWKMVPILKKANVLNKISKVISKTSTFESDYFNFYSDFISLSEKYIDWQAFRVVVLVLPNESPLFIFCAVISAALAAGCGIIVCTTNKKLRNFEFSFLEAGLPDGLCTFPPTRLGNEVFLLSQEVNKVVFFGNFSMAQKIYENSSSKLFSFLCPNNTAALILESCDLVAAIDKILSETWGSNSNNMWGVSTIIVQESIYEKFLNHLKFQLENFNYKKNNSELNDTIRKEKLRNVVQHAEKAGAQILSKISEDKTKWRPTVILQYENQDLQPDIGYINVTICRTAKEGVTLLNNRHYFLGVSVWTEISSQALEVASMLACNCIWINSHGVVSASVPFQLSGICGNFICGGTSGIYQFMSIQEDDYPCKYLDKIRFSSLLCDLEEKLAFKSLSANEAYKLWYLEKDKKSYLQKVADSFEKHESTEYLCNIISYYSHLENIINYSENNFAQDYFTIQGKFPIGVIAIFLSNYTTNDYDTIISLITSALALGNGVIVILEEDIYHTLTITIKTFQDILPKNLIQVITEKEAVLFFASDPSVQGFWIYDESVISNEFFQPIKTCLARTLKHCWLVPRKIPKSPYLFWEKCLQNKTIWLTKVDQFP